MSPRFDRLLAKSRRDGEPFRDSMLLIGHLQDVFESAQRVLDATSSDQLIALGLDPAVYTERFRRCVLLAAAIHDLGKANDHFLGMLTRIRDPRIQPQGLRHEWVTILLLRSMKSWLLPAVGGSETDFAIVEWAVAGHHPGPTHESPPRASKPEAGFEFWSLMGHRDAGAILNWIARVLPTATAGRPVGQDVCWELVSGKTAFTDILGRWRNASILWQTLKREDDRKLVAAVKNCLVAADIAGSALPKAKPDDPLRWNWITEAFNSRPRPGDLDTVVTESLKCGSPRRFQCEVAASKQAVTFVKAGCGSGKTLAAYMWAAANHPQRRLFFCYPTTGTATEGYKNYLFDPQGKLGELGARLFHSRREIDFEVILESGPGEDDSAALQLESLDAWSTPIAACTVDTVLGIIQNNKRGMFAWPALAQSAFVFDEIHSYDDSLFGTMLKFLSDLPGVPVLLMTASLPMPREEAIRRTLAARNIKLDPISGPPEFEELPRYHRVTVADNDPMQLAVNEWRAGGKVLWVCNTVKRVIAATNAAATAGLNPLIYHSHFRYFDRVQRHKQVVGAFTKDHVGPALAICSQVAEMSLDLEGCTLLITDLATIPAAIQRLGRLNRQAKSGDVTRPFFVIQPEHPAPYSAAELEACRQWLGKLPNQSISQRHLSDCWDQAVEEIPTLSDSAWLDEGPITKVRELRELSSGITVLLRDDVENLKSSRGRNKDIGGYLLPMNPPRDMRWQEWDTFKGIPIVERFFIDYNAERGGQWLEKSNVSALIV